MEVFSEIVSLVPQLRAGQMGAVGSAIMILVRIYRMLGAPWPRKGREWLAQLAIFLVSLLASLLVGALVGGIAWPVALVEAFAIGATAITAHEITASIGTATRKPELKLTPEQKSLFRTAGSIIIPAPKAEVRLSMRELEDLKARGNDA